MKPKEVYIYLLSLSRTLKLKTMKQIEITDEAYELLVGSVVKEGDTDPEVLNQKSRIEKFGCWMVYGHLYRDGVCLRCGKKQKDGPGSKLNIERINEMINNPY